MIKRFLNISDLESLLKAKSEYGSKCKILAGGTDLVVRMKADMIDPDTILSIRNIDEMKGIIKGKDSTVIGALTSHTSIEENALIRKQHYPLYQGVYEIGSPQIRNMGTLGGNIANASPSGDTIAPLMVMGAKIKLMSRSKERLVPVDKFFKGPGKTVMADDEIIHSVIVPAGFNKKNSGFIKAGMRKALSIAVISVGWSLKDNKLTLAFGGAAPIVTVAEIRKDCSAAELKKKVLNAISPISDLRASKGYREQVILNLVNSVMEALN